jgi:uncharacterized protein
MSKKEIIDNFLNSGRIAVAGVSRSNKKFGNIVYTELKKKGYNVVPVNPDLPEVSGEKCYASVNDIPGDLDAVVTVIPPAGTVNLLKDIKRRDIKIVWMQSGSESEAAIDVCKSNGIDAISGECILMFTQPEGIHKFHRFINKIFKKLPI